MLPFKSLLQVQESFKTQKLSCIDLVNWYLSNIHKNEHLNAFLEVYEEEARKTAVSIDKKIKDGIFGKLTGLIIAIKDNICYKDHIASASSKILQTHKSLYSSTVVERLLAEDAIIIGRTNCDEFAMGSSNENSAFGNVLNAADNTKVPGGSSGGSAVAVQADLCMAALGSDTGGSVRQPAAFCGIIGLKPTYSRVSRHGLIAYGSSFDQIGPFTKSITDIALIMETIAGKDNFDSTVSSLPVPEYSKMLTLTQKVKVAYIKDCVENDGLDKEIQTKIFKTIKFLTEDGNHVDAVDFPLLDYVIPTYQVLTTAEASSNLARFDGAHYGYRSSTAKNLEENYKKSRTEGFGKEVKRKIMLGTFVLSEGYYDAYYNKAQKVRRMIYNATQDILKNHDFIILPTTPTTAFNIGEKSNDPIALYLEDIFTLQAPLTGMPAISIPIGTHTNGLPFGLQIIAKKFDEAGLLAFSNYLLGSN